MSKYHKINVPLKNNFYQVIVGSNILKKTKKIIFSKIKHAKKIFIITDTEIKRLHLKKILNLVPKKIIIKTITLNSGEKAKELQTINKILNFLLKNKVSRNDAIFGLGGGVIGDISGFVASIALRGINLVHFPTTLLAQVDSSVGGKTGVNSSYGKNLIGTFYQPKLVVCDINLLNSLPKRQLISGYAEVIKYGLINDKIFFNWLEKNIKKILNNNQSALIEVVKKSVITKKNIVLKDEKDLNNTRALLNLGHTYGHSMEKCSKYSNKLLHGEAVSIGICMASKLSNILGFLPSNELIKIENILLNFGLPINMGFLKKLKIKKKDIINNMIYDKKYLNGKLNFVLCKKIGNAFIFNNVKKKNIEDSIS